MRSSEWLKDCCLPRRQGPPSVFCIITQTTFQSNRSLKEYCAKESPPHKPLFEDLGALSFPKSTYCSCLSECGIPNHRCALWVGGSDIADSISKCEAHGPSWDLGELVWLTVALFFWLELPKEHPRAMLVPFSLCKYFHVEMPILWKGLWICVSWRSYLGWGERSSCNFLDNLDHVGS